MQHKKLIHQPAYLLYKMEIYTETQQKTSVSCQKYKTFILYPVSHCLTEKL